jgi:fatty acid desaturase
MKQYVKYENVDQELLKNDIEYIKSTLGNVGEEDYRHLLKLQLWGRISTFIGFILLICTNYIFFVYGKTFIMLLFIIGSIAALLIALGNVNRWANIAHPILHGAYDKVPKIPFKYTKDGFASGVRRYIDWFDWIKPDAWIYEHNIMHHYHLGEDDDPDNVEKNLKWLHDAKIPMIFKYITVYAFAFVWKAMYYAPNTLRILENKERKRKNLEPTRKYKINPFSKNGRELWLYYLLPYGIFKFILIPFLFFVFFGIDAILITFYILLVSEFFANLHSFLVIVPNHTAEDIYQFDTPHKSQGEYYLRQIMGSVNYNTGNDLIDFAHGFLNYQIEHHLFPNMPHSFYQKMQPLVKDICKKHNLEYRQQSVFKRIKMTVDLMVGKTKVLRIEGI